MLVEEDHYVYRCGITYGKCLNILRLMVQCVSIVTASISISNGGGDQEVVSQETRPSPVLAPEALAF